MNILLSWYNDGDSCDKIRFAYPLESSRFRKHFDQFRQRVFRVRLFRDTGDIVSASVRLGNCQQTDEKYDYVLAAEHRGEKVRERDRQREKKKEKQRRSRKNSRV